MSAHSGITRTTAKEIHGQLPRPLAHASTTRWSRNWCNSSQGKAKQLKPGERFPGSTGVLESCFGKLKEMEKQQARGGFTTLIIAFGAILANTTAKAIQAALQQSRTVGRPPLVPRTFRIGRSSASANRPSPCATKGG